MRGGRNSDWQKSNHTEKIVFAQSQRRHTSIWAKNLERRHSIKSGGAREARGSRGHSGRCRERCGEWRAAGGGRHATSGLLWGPPPNFRFRERKFNCTCLKLCLMRFCIAERLTFSSLRFTFIVPRLTRCRKWHMQRNPQWRRASVTIGCFIELEFLNSKYNARHAHCTSLGGSGRILYCVF